jgi:hypothetical protein
VKSRGFRVTKNSAPVWSAQRGNYACSAKDCLREVFSIRWIPIDFESCFYQIENPVIRHPVASIGCKLGAAVVRQNGNTYEWAQDWYSDDYYEVSRIEDPSGPITGAERVIRGEYYESGPDQLRSAARCKLPANVGIGAVAARLVIQER